MKLEIKSPFQVLFIAGECRGDNSWFSGLFGMRSGGGLGRSGQSGVALAFCTAGTALHVYKDICVSYASC